MARFLNLVLDQSLFIQFQVTWLHERSELCDVISDLLVLLDLFHVSCVLLGCLAACIAYSYVTEEHRIEILCYAVLDALRVE